MTQFNWFVALLITTFLNTSCSGAVREMGDADSTSREIIVGAAQPDVYLPLVKSEKVAVVANQTSMVNGRHLIDQLLAERVHVVKVFAPEHGFRGEAGPGDKVSSGKDSLTGLPIISLYGSHKKPTREDLKGVNIVVFDIQDVGARFYTYISTLHYVMEACAENNIKLVVLDRPNPNGFYVDGPVLDTAFKSFVGIAPIPVVHGLTFGEYAMMANGEGWLEHGVKCEVEVVKIKNYNHNKLYQLPVNPSPNLQSMNAIYLYPSLCFFEGAAVSVGRGTNKPFEMIGYPGFKNGNITDVPHEIPGVIKSPPYEKQTCTFLDMSGQTKLILAEKRIMIEWVKNMYDAYPDKENFFNKFFDTLAGTDTLRKQIISGISAAEIRNSWQPGLNKFKKQREKYLLYSE